MVKSKKMSKGSLAVIILAVLLVLSMVLGLTGAWFTDKKNGTDSSLTFGTVKLNVTEGADGVFTTARTAGEDETTNVMPGDTLKVDLTVAKTDDSADFYYTVILTISAKKAAGTDGVSADLTIPDAIKNGLQDTTVYDTSVADTQYKAKTVVLDGASYNNDWQGATITVNYEVRAIQKANLTAENASYMLNAGWNNGEPTATTATTGA
mgnify:CR=1 FL=1